MITKTFIAEPIMTPAGQLVGCELLTRLHREDLPVLNSKYFIMAMSVEEKRNLLIQQLEAVEANAAWFRDHHLFCTVNVESIQARLCVIDTEIKNVLLNGGQVKGHIALTFNISKKTIVEAGFKLIPEIIRLKEDLNNCLEELLGKNLNVFTFIEQVEH